MATSAMYEIERNAAQDYEILSHLGKGTYGEVVMAIDKKMDKRVALKMMQKERTKREAFLHELVVSIFLNGHEGIIFTYSSYMDSLDHYIFTQELAPAGSLHSIIQTEVGMPEKLVKRCALQLSQALEYMHSKALVHRDLKPDNVLLMDKRCHRVKLSDFGLTQLVGTVVPSMAPIIPYMSPELCELKRDECIVVEPSVDVWALGVLLYVALTGYFPWTRALLEDPMFQRFGFWQSNNDHVPPPVGWKNFSRRAQDLFHLIFSKEPSHRKQVGVVLQYLEFPWILENEVEEIIDVVEYHEDPEVNSVTEIIILEDEDEFIIIENRGDVECILVDDPSSEFDFNQANTTVVLVADSGSLYIGSEVEI